MRGGWRGGRGRWGSWGRGWFDGVSRGGIALWTWMDDRDETRIAVCMDRLLPCLMTARGHAYLQ